MRVLVVPGGPIADDPLGPAALVRALADEGVTAWLRPGPGEDGAGEASAGGARPRSSLGRALGEVQSLVGGWARRRDRRPDVALVFAGPSALPSAALLAARRVPRVAVVPDVPTTGFGTAHLALARLVQAIVTPDPEVARRLETDLGIRGVEVLGGGELDLADLPAGSREEARATIGLEPRQRFLALTGPLDPPLALEPVAFAHRRLAGVGLLVIGTGAGDPLVAAMTAATRPSSPVLHIPTLDREARRIAVQAADAVLALHPNGVTEDALLAAAVGRVQVSPEHPELARIDALYPGLEPVVRIPSPVAAGSLGAGIETALARGPLPDESVAAARRALGRSRPVDQLLEVLDACGSSS